MTPKSNKIPELPKNKKSQKPPRPPNAFILYRRSKHQEIVDANKGITNNEVSKKVGEMWHNEPLEVKIKFHLLSDAAKLEHMQKYPEYKYQPHRPDEIRRRRRSTNSSKNGFSYQEQVKTEMNMVESCSNLLSDNLNLSNDFLVNFQEAILPTEYESLHWYSTHPNLTGNLNNINHECNNYYPLCLFPFTFTQSHRDSFYPYTSM
ncbi:40733_t:CDS:1 [Gigaspora margarita]|uniref:40733_t:CDS:1 n=1 Tax=Gigaspora margarita TaxID=4874 RepID=A0ABN7UDE5_GIGMA|nr:40733_t:CDS:1 [Gigaspora margarita]